MGEIIDHRRIRIGLGLLLIGIGLVGLSWSGVALVDAQSNETVDSSEELDLDVVDREGPSLEELRDGGTPLPDAPPGVRTDGQRLWWAVHWPADAVMGSPGEFDDAYEERVDSTTTVTRTSVYLRTVAIEDRERTETVKVAFWREGTREVEDGNVTRTVDVAEDVQVKEHEISYRAGMPIMEIPLGTTDEPRRVTMWLEGSDGPRWTFTHEPVATAEPIAVGTVGDFWGLAALYLVVPIVGGLAVGGSVGKKAIDRAGKGPGYPIGGWLVGIGLLVGMGLLFAFGSIAELIGVLPYAVGLFVALVGLIIILESQAIRERTVEFVKPTINAVGGPDGSEAVEVLEVERSAETVVDMPSGDPAVVRSGLRPFLARAFGSSATVPSVAFDTRIDVSDTSTGSSSKKVDEFIVVDPDAEEVLEYESEGFEIDPPETRSELYRLLAIAGVAGSGLVAVGMRISWLWAVLGAFVVGSILILKPTDGVADVRPAKAHVRSAWISSMLLSRDVEDAKTLEDARETIISQQGRGERHVQEAIETQDATLVEEMLGAEVSRTLEGSDGPDVYEEELNDGRSSESDEEEETESSSGGSDE